MDTRSIFNIEADSEELMEFSAANDNLKSRAIDIYNHEKHQEIVDERNVFYAYSLIKNMDILNSRDLFVYCAATNLISAFIKQANDRGEKKVYGYFYKGISLRKIIKTYRENFPDVQYFANFDGGNTILFVCLGPTVFSFHGVKKDALFNEIEEEGSGFNPFDGVRKQFCALSTLKIGEEIAKNGGEGYKNALKQVQKDMEAYDASDCKKELLIKTLN